MPDVTAGVDAWTRRAAPAPPPDPVADGPEADPEAVARKILLDQLTGRARSRKELSDKLRGKNVPDDVATRLLDRFEEVGLVDDEAFARAWVERAPAGQGAGPPGAGPGAAPQGHRRRDRPRGARRDRPGDDEEAAARALVRKKLRSLRGLDETTATRRLVGMLARKGYGPGLAFRVVKDELGADLSEES